MSDITILPKFTPSVCVFDEKRDLAEVDQFGVVDLRAAFVNHSVPDNVELSAESFNGVEDADSLLGRPSDIFDAIRKADYVAGAVSAAAASDKAAATSGGTE